MRTRLKMFLATVWYACFISGAHTEAILKNDRGGEIGHYLNRMAAIRDSGERVIIDEDCLSACTLVLGIVPNDRICATRRALFGFHAAWHPSKDGRPIASPAGTQKLMEIYPAPVREWIASTPEKELTTTLRYVRATTFVQLCAAEEELIASRVPDASSPSIPKTTARAIAR